jgi:hypothetical protein
MIGNLNALTQESDSDVVSDFWRLSGPGQFICRFPEDIACRLVRETRGEKRFQFIHPELTEAESVAPGSAALFIVALHNRDVIADDKVGKGTILPIGGIHVLVGDNVIGCALREERESPGKSSGKQDGIRHIARRHNSRSDSSDMLMFPCELFLHAHRMGGGERHHDMGRPGPMDRMP